MPILQIVEPEVASTEPKVMGDAVEPEVASTEPQVMGNVVPIAVIQEYQHEGIDDEIDDYDINEEAFYDVNWLPHDPGERILISSYNPNDQADVRKKIYCIGGMSTSRT